MKNVDTVAAKELYLFIENDGNLYRQMHDPIIKNLVQKIDRGVYDSAKSVKIWLYLADEGARRYVKAFAGQGDKWNEIFSKPTREAVAKEFAVNFEEECKLGSYESHHKKKYTGKAGALKNPAGRGRAYRGFSIQKSGDNFRIRDAHSSYMSGVAANYATAKKWIDQHIYEKANRGVRTAMSRNPASSEPITKVIFRKWKVQGDIIAIFPELSYRQNYRTEMYQHVGQHGEGDYQQVVSATVPAKPTEYADLKRELEGIGYRLKVVQKAKINWK